MTPLTIGTRGSQLAMTQAQAIADRLAATSGREVKLVPISTQGDRDQASPLESLGGQGVFVAALREAVLAGEVDLAVHSLKDLPTAPHPGLLLAAIPLRADPRDAVVARDGLTLGELPAGSRVGTGSPRRVAQINALGLGLDVLPIRGNVDTRLGKVASGEYDAVIVALAGLVRLSRADEATELLDPIQILPAPGQGALACECRVDDDATAQILAVLDDPDTRSAVTAERSLLATMEAGCTAPIGALAEVVSGDGGDELWLRGVVADISGTPIVRLSATGSPNDPAGVGERLAAELLASA
ncbi:MAG TPA: hydroxymethylbilane synthase [Aeromicrobium sp.]|nr:hydroxymethylbilane synthase [Aeromicrobium sp.]